MESGPARNQELADLSEEFFQVMHSADPFSATMLGVSGFDAWCRIPAGRGHGQMPPASAPSKTGCPPSSPADSPRPTRSTMRCWPNSLGAPAPT